MATTKGPDLTAEIDRLESLPQVVLKALELINDPRSTPQQLADALALDQSLTTRVLTLASSAFYGSARRFPSLREALVRIGFNSVRSLIITASVAPVLDRPLPGYRLDRGLFWRHSVACGLCARNIATMIRHRDRDEAYIAGLMHDIGKLINDRRLQADSGQVYELVERMGMPFVEAERMVLGFDHAQIGGLVIEKWGLSPALAEAVAYHHAPVAATSGSLLPHIVHVADAITHMLNIGDGAVDPSYRGNYDVVRQLGLDVQQTELLTTQLTESLAQADSFLTLKS